MYRTIFVVLASFLCTVSYAEKPVPVKTDVPSVCGFPGVQFPKDTVILAAGALGGKAIDFQIDQSGNVSTQIDVAVNYPDKPIALMLGASEPTIWNIAWTEGTNIVAVFASGHNRQRVAGLKMGTPLLTSNSHDNGPCSTSAFSYEKLNLHDSFVASFGYGQITNVKEATVEQKLSQILYSRPISKIYSVPHGEGKVVIGTPLKPTQLLITSPATPPNSFHDKNAPLAGEAGLADAMRRGVLRRATLKDATKWITALKKKYEIQHRQPPDIPPDLNNAYVVLKNFTYPAGLYGGLSATFYIPEGVPQPTGDYGHSKIYDLNSITLDCNEASACGQAILRGEIGRGATQKTTTYNFKGGGAVIFNEKSGAETPSPMTGFHSPRLAGGDERHRLNDSGIPFTRDAAALSQNTELHAVGVYEGPRHFGRPAEDPSSSTINVHIYATKKPIILALYNYESVLWNISADKGVEIKEIILSSHNASKVSGIDDKIVKVTRLNMGLAYDNSTAHSVVPKLTAYTGLSIGSFQSSYKGTEFSIGR